MSCLAIIELLIQRIALPEEGLEPGPSKRKDCEVYAQTVTL